MEQLKPHVNSFMVARCAQANVSCLQPLSDYLHQRPLRPPHSRWHVMREYLLLAVEYDLPFQNAKFTLIQMVPPKASPEHAPLAQTMNVDVVMPKLTQSKTMLALW